jgi:hypothetical protein
MQAILTTQNVGIKVKSHKKRGLGKKRTTIKKANPIAAGGVVR